MIIDQHASRQDRSLDSKTADNLDRGPFVENLVRALVRTNTEREIKHVRSTGYTVGLVGKWGSGKSSIIYLLSQQLGRMDRVIVSVFNPWLFKGRDELVQAYFNGLRSALGRSPREEIGELQKSLDRYRTAIDLAGGTVALYADLHGAAGTASKSWQTVKTWLSPKARTPDEERATLEAKLVKANVAVVVLIDELDRVEDEEVRAVAQLIKAVGDIKGISYLVAYDHSRVADALGRGGNADERMRNGSAYLEKIIQFAIPIRPLFSEDVKRLLTESLLRFELTLPEPKDEHASAIFDGLVEVIETPREVKRLAGAFAVYEQVVRGEIDTYDVLAYSWLATRLPDTRQRIADDLDRVVDDPEPNELMRRIGSSRERLEKRQLFDEVFGALPVSQRRLLTALFPTFAESSSSIEGNRLSKRRNLVRLLFFGDPPDSVSRTAIEAIWELTTPDAVAEALQGYRSSERLRQFLQRVADLLPTLPVAGHGAFWTGLSRALLRTTDWLYGAESLGDAADDAGQMLWNYGVSGELERSCVFNVITRLREDGDLLLLPFLLRRSFSSLGLGIYRQERSDKTLLTKEEAYALLREEEPRYRDAIASGFWLRRVPDSELLYVLPNIEHWTQELRASLTAQMNTLNAVTTFAVLTVRPGYVSTYESMNELLDADAVASRIASMVQLEGLPADRYLAASVRRLQATLTKHDPHWAEGTWKSFAEVDEVLFAVSGQPDGADAAGPTSNPYSAGLLPDGSM